MSKEVKVFITSFILSLYFFLIISCIIETSSTMIQVKAPKNSVNNTNPSKAYYIDFDSIMLLAMNNYYESRGVGGFRRAYNLKKQDMINITSVVLNRVDSGKFGGTTLEEVIYARRYKQGRHVCQFSWTCDPKLPSIDHNSREWQLAYDVAFEMFLGYEPRVSYDVYHYYNPKVVKPHWSKNRKIVTYVKGGHVLIQ